MKEDIVEVLVPCKQRTGLIILRFLFYLLAAAAAFLWFMGAGFVAFLIAAALGIAGYYVGTFSFVEYEYAYCDKEIDIDVIYCQQKRKHLLTLDTGKIEAIVRVGGSKMKEYENRQQVVKKYDSGKKENADKVYALMYDGTTEILMEPGERLLNTLSYVCPRKIYKD